MAISLGFGVLLATALILLIVPCSYLILDDIKALGERLRVGMRGSTAAGER